MTTDTKTDTTANPNPFVKANCWSRFFFCWLNYVVRYGRKHDFDAKNLYDTISEDRSENLTYSLESAWSKETVHAQKRGKNPRLWKAVVKTYCWDFIKSALFSICYAASQLMQPHFLYLIMSYFQPTSSKTSGWAYINATKFVALVILQTILFTYGNFLLNRLGMRARIACTSLIYRKLIRLSSAANQKMSNSVISLISVDAAKFENLFIYAPFIIIAPVQLLIATVLICQYITLSATAISVVLLILQTFPIQAIYSKMALKFRAQQTTRTDFRISLISEIINGILTVKMYVWEQPLENLVFIARNLEIASYANLQNLSAVVSSITSISYRTCVLAVAIYYTLHGKIITAQEILPVTQHLMYVKINISFYFFSGLKNVIDMSVSMKRIQDFLLLEEVKSNVQDVQLNANQLIFLQNVTACWNKNSVVIKDASLDFAPKKFYAIIGSIGSGKSTLLRLILRELQIVSGKVFICGKVSYASQEPWLFNSTIKDNILFGEMYDTERYEVVVKACALTNDFSQLQYGDHTLVGERGSNLSGGQRARVNLARAVYRQAETYLLDNPLSAVDATVGKKIMQDCFNGLLRDKTRILVTHSVQQLDNVSEIILLENESGEVKFKGNVQDLRQSGLQMARFTKDETEKSEKNTTNLEIDDSVNVERSTTNNEKEPLEMEELLTKGTMKSSVYLNYLKAGGWSLGVLVILTNVLFIISASIFDFGPGAWTINKNEFPKHKMDDNLANPINDTVEQNSLKKEKIIFVLGCLMALTIFTSMLKFLFLSKFALNASKNIHNNIFSRLMRTTLMFFNANSTGKILNRFSEDTSVLDNTLPPALSVSVNTIFHSMAILLSTVITNWWILIPVSILTFITLSIGKLCVNVIQKIKRVAGNARSPILSFVASSLEGGTTIRACKAEHIVTKIFDTRQDQRTSAEFISIALPQVFSLRLELIYVGFFASMTYLFIIIKNDNIYEGGVGLTLMQILSLSQTLPYHVIKATEIFAHMTSVERILQFESLKQENSMEDEAVLDLPTSWPHKGEIIFKHLYLRYSVDSDPVLRDLNFHIRPGSKVGVVGRTGAGKSSLISALFRFAKINGLISIDGMDIEKLDLYKLRSKISVIPQEPILFKTSLRKNLDPLGKFNDATLYSALESVELKLIFGSLDIQIERGGSNLSVGQRQLLCLARAIIHKNKILVLDEATANVDTLTDAVIQRSIRQEFKECTVLTIAHRFNTVMDSDKIMVMDSGRLMEYDHPFLLLQNKESYFYKMVQQGSEATLQHFKSIAKQAYFKNRENR